MEILAHTFVQNAILAGLLVSIVCGIMGTLIIINKMVFIASGIAHGAYGGLGLAFFFGFAPLLGAGAFSIFLAFLIAYLTLNNKSRIDSVIGALAAFGMALGIILVDLTPGYNVDLLSYLFGSILAVSNTDLFVMLNIDLLVIVLCVGLYSQFQALSFDNEFASLRGVRTNFLYYLLIILIAFCVVATIRAVGLFLVIALITIPPYIAEKFCKRLGSMMFLSVIFACIFCLSGLYLSYELNLTSGAAIIAIASFSFFLSVVANKLFSS